MNRAVTWFFLATGGGIALLGAIALFARLYLVGILLVVSGGADVFMGVRRLRTPIEASKPPGSAVTKPLLRKTPVPIPDLAALSGVPEPVSACPDCGFLGIRSAGVRGGGYAGGGMLLSAGSCPRCKYNGLPLAFERREDYVAFIEQLHVLEAGPTSGGTE